MSATPSALCSNCREMMAAPTSARAAFLGHSGPCAETSTVLPPWQLHLGGCVEGMAAMGDKSIDVSICDPEYSEHVHKCGRRGNTGYDGDTGRASISRNRELPMQQMKLGVTP